MEDLLQVMPYEAEAQASAPVDCPNSWSVYDYIDVGLKGMPPRALGGIDVTYRCNLKCKHCG